MLNPNHRKPTHEDFVAFNQLVESHLWHRMTESTKPIHFAGRHRELDVMHENLQRVIRVSLIVRQSRFKAYRA